MFHKKSFVLGVSLFLLCLFALPAQAIEEQVSGYDWSRVTPEMTRESSGTGGTELRQDAPINDDEADFPVPVDPVTGQQLTLSDMFYDGYNYIAYINDRIAPLCVVGEAGQGDEEDDVVSTGRYVLKSPFTGLPADYPYFSVKRNSIRFALGSDNPFFDDAFELVRVPLWHGISPYGQCLAEATVWERVSTDWIDTEHFCELIAIMTDGEDTAFSSWRRHEYTCSIYFPAIRLDDASNPEADVKVQAALVDMLAELRSGDFDTELFFAEEGAFFHHKTVGNLLFVHVPMEGLGGSHPYYPFSNVLLWGVYDIHTGEAVPTGDWLSRFEGAPGIRYYYGRLPRDIDDMYARWLAEKSGEQEPVPEDQDYTEYDDDDEAYIEDDEVDRGELDTSYNEYEHEMGDFFSLGNDYFHTAETYAPPPGTVCVGAWPAEMTYDEDCIMLELREPDGTPRRASIPMSYFEETWGKGQ